MGNAAEETLIEEPSQEDLMRRNREALALVESWMKEDPAYDLETLPMLKKALDAGRAEVGARQLFANENSTGR